MKFSSLVLAASLAANLALVGALLVGATDDSPENSARPAAAAPPLAATHASAGPDAETWTALSAADLSAQVERLRAEDFPPTLIRAIMTARVREGFAARRKALEAAQSNAPYWKNARPDPATQAALRELRKAEQKALTDLLGPDAENGTAATLHRQFPTLADDKVTALAEIRDRYDELRQDVYAKVTNTMLPEEQEKITALDKAMHDEFARALSPQELEDYDLRTSRSANQLRNNLTAFDATEQEFRTLYKLQSAFDAQFPPYYSAPSEEQMKARSAGQKQLNDDIKAALGDTRFADYQRASNFSFRQTSQLVDRLELPPETATQVYSVQQDIQKRASTIRQDHTLSPDDRTAQLTTLATEAQTRVTASLGTQGFEAYKQYGGTWLQNLVPRPPPKP